MQFSSLKNGQFQFEWDEKNFHIALGCLRESWRTLDEETFPLFFEQSIEECHLLMDKLATARNSKAILELGFKELEMVYKAVFVSMANIHNWEFSILIDATKSQCLAFADEIEVPLLEMKSLD